MNGRTKVGVGDRVRIVGGHPWSGYAGVVEGVDHLTGDSDNGITVLLDCGLRATVAGPKYWEPLEATLAAPVCTYCHAMQIEGKRADVGRP